MAAMPENKVVVDWNDGAVRRATASFLAAYIHEQARKDVLPGWEFWGTLPTGERIYGATRSEVERAILAAIASR